MCDDSNKNITQPSQLIDKTLSDLKTAKEHHLNAADEIHHSIQIVEAVKTYWDHADPNLFQVEPIGIESINYLGAMSNEAASIRAGAADNYAQARAFSSTASGLGTVTTTAYSFVSRVNVFNPLSVIEVIESPDKYEKYAKKFDAFDPELGKLYRQIHEVDIRTSSHPAKSILPDARQAYDHLMRKLAPDDEVRAQPNWTPNDPQKPDMVTRLQRLDYAATKHIHDKSHLITMLTSSRHILAVHEALNELYHTEKPIDVGKAKSAYQAMIEVLNQWADVLGL